MMTSPGCIVELSRILALSTTPTEKPARSYSSSGIDAGMLGGLAAYQSAARLHAALGYALDDLGNLLRNVLAAGNVIQKDQRLGTGSR